MSLNFVNYCFENDWTIYDNCTYQIRLTQKQENSIKTYIRNGGRRTDCACIEWGPGEDNDPDGEEIGVLMSIIRTIGPVSTSSMMLFIKNRFPEITVNILNDKLCEMLKQGLIQTISFSQ